MVAQFSAQDCVMSANFLKWKKMKTSIRFYNDRKSVPSTSVVSTSSTTDAPVPEPVEGTATMLSTFFTVAQFSALFCVICVY